MTTPGLEIDHLVMVVDRLDDAARRLTDATGLRSIDGGRHHGLGTGNHIVPLGDAYLELLAVVDPDEARANAWGRWALAATGDGRSIHAVCLRTSALDATAARLGTPIGTIARTTPQGRELRARLTGTEQALGARQLPFFIQWDVPDTDRPARQPIEHDVDLRGGLAITLGGNRDELDQWIGRRHPAIRTGVGPPGAFGVAIGVEGGSIVL